MHHSPESNQLLRTGRHGRRRHLYSSGGGGGGGGGGDSGGCSGTSLDRDGEEKGGEDQSSTPVTPPLSREEREAIRLSMVKRRKDFKLMEKVNGKLVNVAEGIELHTGVFSLAEQKRIVDCVYDLQERGRGGKLRDRTYSEPRKWMRGKGRVTLQFGCCYNYAVDKHGNPPGILRDEEVDPIPPLLKTMIKRMVSWHVLPPTCIPNSCIINIYDKDDCIPPHIDHHDFVRPFCTVSFLSECNILLGTELKIVGPGEFSGPMTIPLPVGSVLILNGNGADLAKHCVPAVPSKRISITFRKMDDRKLPYEFSPDPDLQKLQPLPYPSNSVAVQQSRSRDSALQSQVTLSSRVSGKHKQLEGQKLMNQGEQPQISSNPFQLSGDDFPPLGSSSSGRPIRQ